MITRRTFASSLPLLAMAAVPTMAATPVAYKIVTASERGTYIQIGNDLARLVAPAAGIELEVLSSAGSAENVQRLRYEPGVKFALVQSDVYQAFIDQAISGNSDAGQIIRPLRVIMPLYNEELYFVVRADSPLNFVHEIRDARINVGPLRSGTAMSATTIYRQMYGRELSEARFFTNEEALIKLTRGNELDVVVVVAGQPAKLLVDMKTEARKLIKLLKFDPANPASLAVLKTYYATNVLQSNYPSLLTEDIPSIAVKAFLVTYDFALGNAVDRMVRFARALCQNFPKLQAEGHPKWKEVQLAVSALPRGWSYYAPTERELRNCVVCTQEAKVLGLCK